MSVTVVLPEGFSDEHQTGTQVECDQDTGHLTAFASGTNVGGYAPGCWASYRINPDQTEQHTPP